jgi:peptide/nickel transport system permease protein
VSRYVIARILAVIPALFLLIIFVVVLVRLLPGDAIDVMLQEQARSQSADRAEIERRMGLDRSIPEEVVHYSVGVLRGDLGNSLWSQRDVTELIGSRVLVTLKLGVIGLSFAVFTGIMIGLISAVRQNGLIDYLLRSFSIIGLSVPNFAVATLVIVMPVLWWGWSPSVIYTAQNEDFIAHYRQFIIPGLILGLSSSATLMRITRTAMLEVLRQDYVRTARAKGLGEATVIRRHALRNALIPVVSLLGLQVASLVSGTVIIESVFGLPGIGRLLITSLGVRDYPVVQGITLMAGISVMVTNLIVDLSYNWIDPRASVG